MTKWTADYKYPLQKAERDLRILSYNKDGENFLVIQVQRRGNSEIGTGGIVYPCFIFTGPQLEKRAPDGELEYRLLPGGAIEKIKK